MDEWWAKVVRQTLQESINEKVSDSMVSGLYTYFSTKSPYELHINVVELLQRWCMIDIKLGIISNSDPRLRMVIQDFDLEKFLYSKDSYSISYEVDFEKPDVCIFKDAEQRLQSYLALTKSDHGIDRRRLWHVGDDLEKDFKGSLKAGWNAVLVDRSRKFLDSPGSLEGLDGAVVEHSFDGRLALIRSSPIGIICDSLISLEEIF